MSTTTMAHVMSLRDSQFTYSVVSDLSSTSLSITVETTAMRRERTVFR